MKHLIYLALGSNLGDRAKNLRSAIDNLAPKVKVSNVSPVYQTPPWGYEDQPSFLNQVIVGGTRLSPLALMKYLKKIESTLGRQPTFQNGPRVIDIDILFYDDLVINQPELVIPHPRLHNRAFVVVPLFDLAPELIHPVLGFPVKKFLSDVDRAGIEKFSEG